MTAIRDSLAATVGTGELVTIVYNAGSRPGQPRQVVPLSILKDELIAAEPGSSANKHFKLVRIARIDLSNGSVVVNDAAEPPPPVSDIPEFSTLPEYAERYAAELQALGWHTQQTDTSFSVGTYLKNGKPRKTPSISIQYSDPRERMDLAFDLETEELAEVQRPVTGRERPWSVYSPHLTQAKTFKRLHQAFELFLTEARALGASNKPPNPKTTS